MVRIIRTIDGPFVEQDLPPDDLLSSDDEFFLPDIEGFSYTAPTPVTFKAAERVVSPNTRCYYCRYPAVKYRNEVPVCSEHLPSSF